MNLPQTTPAQPSRHQQPSCTCNSNICQRALQPIRTQLTMWGFVQPHLPTPTTIIHDNPPPAAPIPPATHTQPQEEPALLPDSQEMAPPPPPDTLTQESASPLQTTITTECTNEPWGDIWTIQQPTQSFRVFSKNIGTINPLNLNMLTITTELQNMGASVFTAQETNIHWDPASTNQIYTQCRQAASHVFLATSSSQEPSSDWYKPGGTLLMALGPCTSRIVNRGSDQVLGHWSFIEFVGKNNTRFIVVSAYRVCNQKFDAASNTVTAQQI